MRAEQTDPDGEVASQGALVALQADPGGPPIAYADPDSDLRRRRIFRDGTAPNTRRAYQTDHRYWQAWHRASFGQSLAIPLPVEAVERFVLDHVDGLPAPVEAALAVPWTWPDGTVAVPKRRPGPPALATLERRLAALAAMPCRVRSLLVR